MTPSERSFDLVVMRLQENNMNMTSLKSLAVLIVAISPFFPVYAASPSEKIAALPSIYIEKGKCPGVSCTCNQWTTRSELRLLARPNAKKNKGVLKKGEALTSSIGAVYVVPAKVNVIRAYEEDGRSFKAGDSFYLLQYLYEGMFKAWAKGEFFEVYGGGISGLKNFFIRPEKNESWGEVYEKYSNERWVQVKTASGLVGWALENDLEFPEDDDACRH